MTTAGTTVTAFIVLVIVIGYYAKVNYGLLGILFAFVGGWILGLPEGSVISLWPGKLFFQMFSIAFFYAFPINNGTLSLLVRRIVYAGKSVPFLLPVLLFLIGGVVAAIGPGGVSAYLILIPIFMQVAKEIEMSPSLAVILTVTGVNLGAWSPISVTGVAIRGLISAAGFSNEAAASLAFAVFRNSVVVALVIFGVSYLLLAGWRCKKVVSEKPEAFTRDQRITLILVMLLTVLLIVPNLLNGLIEAPLVAFLAKNLSPIFLAVLFGILAVVFRVGGEKEAIAHVPWSTILTVCGMGMLVAVVTKAGIVELLAEYIGGNYPAAWIPYILCLIAAVMSLFTSTTGVVLPTIYPMIAGISAAAGLPATLLFSIVLIGSAYAGSSPLSLFGGLVMAAQEEEERDKMFFRLIVVTAVFIPAVLVLYAVGLIR